MAERFDHRTAKPPANREKALQRSREAKLAAAERLAALVKGARVDFDARTSSPQFIASTAAFLTGANGEGGAVPPARAAAFANDPHGIVKAFIAEHPDLFGHGPEILEAARVTRDYTTAHNGARTTVWQQEHNGIRIFEAVFQAHLTSNGALVNIASQLLADPPEAVLEGHRANPQAAVEPVVNARRAVSVAGGSLGEDVPEARVIATGPEEGPSRRARFRAPALLDVTAELVWLPVDEGAMRLCWEVVCVSRKRAEMFRTLVDAENGEPLVQQGLTEAISPASYRVFTSDSPTPMSPGHATPLAAQPPTVARALVTTEALNPTASPEGWIADGVNETRGNNVDAHLDLNADNAADLPRPQGVNRVFDPPLDLSQPPQSYRDASVVNLFYWNNVIHDRYYDLGFTEAAGNFQLNNFGRGGAGNDPIQADAQDGSGTNNANFSTPPDGSPGRMQMYIYTGPAPDRDSALDAEIIIHEYTHGLTNRLVGGGIGLSALQSRGMGEGWSDFYALCLLSEATDDPNGTYPKSAYSSRGNPSGYEENYYFGNRRYPYTTDLAKNPLTFKDIDPTKASAHAGIPLSPRYAASNSDPSQVHGQGEFWCVTLWDLRANLVAKHGSIDGNDLALRLVTDGLKLAPPNPTFIQARDAIVQAEMVHTAGSNRQELWTAFAKRGLGAAAAAPGPGTTTGVTESFDVPDSLAVFPASVPRAEGSIGGPFLPARHEFTLSNSAPSPVPWTASVDASWLTLSHTSGTLATGAAVKIEAVLNGGAMNLPAGTYAATVRFTNSSTGISQTRTFSLLVDFLFLPVFAESFESGNLDSAYWTITGTGGHRTQVTSSNAPRAGLQHLTMDASASGAYARNEATLTLNLTGRSNLVLRFWAKSFSDEPDGPPPAPFIGGADFDGVAVSEDGTSWHEVFPLRSLTSEWKQFTVDLDQALAALGLSYTAGFKIRFNHYDNYEIATDGFAFDDIVIAEAMNRRLSVALPARAAEGGPSASATVSVTPVQTSPLLVVLSSSDATEATVPSTVEIPAGASSASFTVSFPDDAELDGTQPAVVSANADTFVPGSAEVLVDDTESATLSLEIPASAVEGGGALTGTVLLDTAPAKAVRVHLATSDVSDLAIPPWVEIPAGETSAPFFLNIVDDSRIDGTVAAQITATVANWVPGVATIQILDNENAALALEPPADLREGDPQRTAKVTLSGTLTSDLVLSPRSSDPSECTVPATVTLYAGQTVATIPVTVIDDNQQDGMQEVTLSVSAPGFAEVSAIVPVRDNEAHHFEISAIASPQVRNAPVPVTITARDISGDLITNYGSPATFTLEEDGASLLLTPQAGAFIGGVLQTELRFGADAAAAALRVTDAAGFSGTSNAFAIGRGPMSGFAFDPIPPVQRVDTPFPITIRAVDAGGNAAEEYDGSVALESRSPGPRDPTSIAKSQSPSGINSGYRQSRLQCIYTPSEVRGAGLLTGVQMDLLVPPTAPLKRFTVRVKHTDLPGYASSWNVWDTDGWTVVYQSDRSFSAGWVEFPFSKPFEYDGVRNLMIDFSYYDPAGWGPSNSNAAYRTDGVMGGMARKAYYFSSGSGDPLNWPSHWFASTTSNLPILRFTELQPHYMRPGLSGAFVNGVWTGTVSVPAAQQQSALVARDQITGSTGMSNPFRVAPPLPLPGSGVLYTEDFESGSLSSQWEITGTSYYQSIVSNANGPHGGLRHLTMSSSNYSSSANWVTWTLDLEGLQMLTLNFWAKGFNDQPHAPPPGPFSSTTPFDGVAISADGVAWHEVQALRSPTGGLLSSTWVKYTIDLDKAVKAAGLAYNRAFRVRFAQFGSDRVPSAGIAIDDIEVVSLPAPSAVRVGLPAQVKEGGPSAIGTVSIPFLAPEDIVVTLATNAPAKLSVSSQVLLPRGQRTAEYFVQAVDDDLADGSKTVTVGASAPFLPSSGSTLLVVDDDAPEFTFSVPVTEVAEGQAAIQAVLTLSSPAAAPLTFHVSSSDETAIKLAGSTVTVLGGVTSATVPLTIVNDSKIDGTQTAIVSIAHGDVILRSPVITVADNETLDLRLSPASSGLSSLREGGSAAFEVYLPGSVTTHTEVTISSSNPARIAPVAPQPITAGSTYAYFVLTAADDALPVLADTVVLTASAPGFNSASYALTWLDNDPDHFTIAPIPSPQVSGALTPLTITARSADGAVLQGFTGTVALSATAGVIAQPPVSGAFVAGVWTGEVAFTGAAIGAQARAEAAGGAFGLSGSFDLGPGEYRALAWDALPPSCAPGADIPIRVRAVDAGGNDVAANEAITPRLMVPGPGISLGGTSDSTSYFLYTYARRARAQVLCLASELNGPSTFSGLELFIRSGASGQNLSNFVIRMKSTSRASLTASDRWDSDGWTTVYRSNRTVDANGAFTCLFDSPWTHDGKSNVLIDFSYNNPVANSSSLSWGSVYLSGSESRMIYSYSSTATGDPLLWSGTEAYPTSSNYLPSIRLFAMQAVPAALPSSAQLAEGEWTGTIAFPGNVEAAFLHAVDSAGRQGYSNRFAVSAASLPEALPFNDGFESGVLGQAWTASGTASGRTRILTTNTPATGVRHAVLDASSSYSRSELTLRLDLRGYSGVTLAFWAKRFSGIAHGPPPSPFTGGADFDGVAISADGTTWYEVQPLRAMSSGIWTQFSVSLDSEIAARSLGYTQDFRIRFNQYGNDYAPYDGIAIDDVAVTGNPVARLQLSLPAALPENGGPTTGSVSLPAPPESPVQITLASSGPGILAVPAAVTIPAGQTSANFSLTPVHRAALTGRATVNIKASAQGWFDGIAATQVTDHENGTIVLSAPTLLAESDGSANAILTISPAPAASFAVALSSSLPASVQMPATVNVTAGQSSLIIPLAIVNDSRFSGPRNVTLRAEIAGWPASEAVLVLADDEVGRLSISSNTFPEGTTGSILVSVWNVVDSDTVVSVASSDPARFALPETVTILAGNYSASAAFTAPNNDAVEGTKPVTVTATAPGLISASAAMSIADNDVHHFTFDPIGPVIRGKSFPVTIRARDINGVANTNFLGTVDLVASGDAGIIDFTPNATTAFGAGKWTGNVTINTFSENVRIQATGPNGITGESGSFSVGLGDPATYAWSPIAAGQAAQTPFPVQISARDAGGNALPDYAGYVFFSSQAVERTIGSGTISTSGVPFITSSQDARSQVIYLASELGGPVTLSSLSLWVASPPGQTLNNWTIQLKHTSLASLPPSPFENTGWSIVHRSNQSITTTGWVTFRFDAPFHYDGTSNLLVDFSFDNSFSSTTGMVRSFYPGATNRVRYSHSNGGSSDPLTWTYLGVSTNAVPQVFFNRGLTGPAVGPTAAFLQNGAWSGQVVVATASAGTVLRATDPSGVFGATNSFFVAAPSDSDNDKLPDAWENEHGLSPADGTGHHGPAGDIDGDGMSNGVEFALNLNPRRFDLHGAPTAVWGRNPADGKDYLEFSYRRRIGSPGLVYTVETATDVNAWTADPAKYQEVGLPSPVGDGITEVVTVRILPAAGTPGVPATFARLRIVTP